MSCDCNVIKIVVLQNWHDAKCGITGVEVLHERFDLVPAQKALHVTWK